MNNPIYLVAWGVTITPVKLANGKYGWGVCAELDTGDIMSEDGDYLDIAMVYEADTIEELYTIEGEIECED